jgi:predicted ATPase
MVSCGAAIGNRFDLGVLASVSDCTPERALELLAPALRDSLLIKLDSDTTGQFVFQHDRVQQAAYALVPAAARPALNLTIGRTLLSGADEEVPGLLFEIVNHMNQGMALIESRAERLRLAKLNLRAATRARNSTAYDLATRACRSAIDLLGWDAWDENYPLTFEAFLRLAECQALLADFEGAFATIDNALPHARATADRGRLLTVRTHTYLSMGDMTGAVACGRQAAQLFGLDLPEEPALVRERLQAEMGTLISWTGKHEIESLLDLPLMTDPDRVVLMSLLMHCLPPAYQVNPELFALICCRMVRLSIEHGNCPMSAKGYGSFAAILSGIVGNFRDGDRFGKLGVDLSERLNDVAVRSACHFTWACFASAWVRPLDESIAVFREGARWGMASGDHPHAAYCAALALAHVIMRGTPLTATRAQADEAMALVSRIGDATNNALLLSRRRFVDWLQVPTPERSLDDAGYDEAATLYELQATSVSKSMLAHFQSLRVMHRFFDGRYAEAWKISRQLDELLMFVPGMMTVVEHAFFQALVAGLLWNESPAAGRAQFEACLEARARSLETWATHCAENYAPLHLTVAAELARIRGAADLGHYERAIAAAQASDFPHIEAIACELAMRHLAAGDPAGAAQMRARAIAAYRAWGAVRMAESL